MTLDFDLLGVKISGSLTTFESLILIAFVVVCKFCIIRKHRDIISFALNN